MRYDPSMCRTSVLLALAAAFVLAACAGQTAGPFAAPTVEAPPPATGAAATATPFSATAPPEPSPPIVATATSAANSTATSASKSTPPDPKPTARPSPSATPATTTFAAIGDYGWSGAGAREVAALVDQWDPELVITLGDNNYPDGAAWTIEENITANYGRFVEDGRFFPTLGNHDLTTENGQPYFDYFDLPGNERYYDFVWGDVHFFAVNSDWREPDGISATSAQAAWLKERLAASTTAWQVVYFHAPPYVSMALKRVPVMAWPFADWGADLVLSGHAHLYERLQVEGLTYIVNGLGGHTIYPFDPIPHPGSQVRYNDDFGALWMEVTAESLHGRFVTRTGEAIDVWSLEAPRQP